MKWLQDNPLGMALVGVSGFFILLSVLLAVLWTRPVQVDAEGVADQQAGEGESVAVEHQLGPLKDFQIIIDKPIFNVTRRPEIVEIDDEEPVVEVALEVKDPPKVKLTGVIITPTMKIASLTPEKGGKDSVMAHEGEPMTGEYVGWSVSKVRPRNVVLESRTGEVLKLDLEVYDTKLKEPPKPVAPAAAAPDEPEQLAGDEAQPIDRAEQIRQRIAERREELRREQEERQAASQDTRAADPRQDYQNAIRAMMNNNRKDNDSDEP